MPLAPYAMDVRRSRGAPWRASASLRRTHCLRCLSAAGASSYNIKRSTVPGGPYTSVGTTASTSYSNTGLANGTTYYYVVSAMSFDEGADSSEKSATPTAAGGGSSSSGGSGSGGSGSGGGGGHMCGVGSSGHVGVPFTALAATLAAAALLLRRKSA